MPMHDKRTTIIKDWITAVILYLFHVPCLGAHVHGGHELAVIISEYFLSCILDWLGHIAFRESKFGYKTGSSARSGDQRTGCTTDSMLFNVLHFVHGETWNTCILYHDSFCSGGIHCSLEKGVHNCWTVHCNSIMTLAEPAAQNFPHLQAFSFQQ